jgi:hypothetical protein
LVGGEARGEEQLVLRLARGELVERACEPATLVLYVAWRAKELGPMADTGLAAEKVSL